LEINNFIQLIDYADKKDINPTAALSQFFKDGLQIYYIVLKKYKVTYTSTNSGSKKYKKRQHSAFDPILLPPNIINEILMAGSTSLYSLMEALAPDGYELSGIWPQDNPKIDVNDLKIIANSNVRAQEVESLNDTALKVIGLLMFHLSETPLYKRGSRPNKSQIQKLLIDIAEKYKVEQYGLETADERVLTRALKYIESKKGNR